MAVRCRHCSDTSAAWVFGVASQHRRCRRHAALYRQVLSRVIWIRCQSDPLTLAVPSGRTDYVAETILPTKYGKCRLRGYRHTVDDGVTFTEPSVIIQGEPEGCSEVAVRVHDACFTSEQLQLSLKYIRDHPPGMVIYLQQEGRGIGLANKIAAYSLQEKGYDTVDANRKLGLPDDAREYTAVRNILKNMQISSIQLITNNPRKIRLLEFLGVKVTNRIPCLVKPSEHSEDYLRAKGQRMDHMFTGEWCYWDHGGEKDAAHPPLPIDELKPDEL